MRGKVIIMLTFHIINLIHLVVINCPRLINRTVSKCIGSCFMSDAVAHGISPVSTQNCKFIERGKIFRLALMQ